MKTKVIHKAFKYRIYPDKNQELFLSKNFDDCRFLWNKLVENFNSYTSEGHIFLNEKILKDDERYSFLKETISYALQQKYRDFFEFKKQYFNKKRKTKLGRPKFKKKNQGKDSFRIPQASMGLKSFIDIKNGSIKVPKLNKRIKLIIDKEFSGIPKSVTFSKTKTGKYYVSILVQEEIQMLPSVGGEIGIDLGIKDLLVLSNGVRIGNPKWLRDNQSEIAAQQRHLSRKVKGSNRYNKQRLKVAKLHEKIVNQRNHFYHNLSLLLVSNYDTIVIEDLAVAKMSQSRSKMMNKLINETSWRTFISMLEYKSRWHDKTVHKVDRYFASTQICSKCGTKSGYKDLSVREWECSYCGATHDRDVNAQKNILYKGLVDLYSFTSAELVDYEHRGSFLSISPTDLYVKGLSKKCLSDFIYYESE